MLAAAPFHRQVVADPDDAAGAARTVFARAVVRVDDAPASAADEEGRMRERIDLHDEEAGADRFAFRGILVVAGLDGPAAELDAEEQPWIELESAAERERELVVAGVARHRIRPRERGVADVERGPQERAGLLRCLRLRPGGRRGERAGEKSERRSQRAKLPPSVHR